MPAPVTPWESVVDRAAAAAERVFGEVAPCTYTPTVGAPYAVPLVFEAMTERIDPDTGAVVLSHQPEIGVRLSQMATVPVQGDRVTIRGAVYKVVEPVFDGQGTATLRLHRVLP